MLGSNKWKNVLKIVVNRIGNRIGNWIQAFYKLDFSIQMYVLILLLRRQKNLKVANSVFLVEVSNLLKCSTEMKNLLQLS